MRVCEVIRPGVLSMVQDLGRRGHYSGGIPDGGVFDTVAFKLGNRLLGNPLGAAGIEVLLDGLCLKFLAKTRIAVTGADLTPKIDQDPVPMWRTLVVSPGQELIFSGRRNGLRAYVLFAGGLEVPYFMESRSTYLFLGKGGFKGRKLEKEDVLETSDVFWEILPLQIPDSLRPIYGPAWEFRIVYGLQYELFTEKSLEVFESEDWLVTPESNRMAIRLQGPALEFKQPSGSLFSGIGGRDPSNIPTEGNPLGAIQCPAGPELIVIGPDGPCEGGYAKIGTIISADFFLLSQIKPGDKITFKSVSLEEAYGELYRQNSIFKEDLELMKDLNL
jgi:antagonist of KipI